MSDAVVKIQKNNKKSGSQEKKNWENSALGEKTESSGPSTGGKRGSEYKKQLVEKQRLKQRVYKLRERQFKRFFRMAEQMKVGETGDNLLVLLERRLDNVVFRLKLALSRKHARQMIVHGHFEVNGKAVKSPSILVKENDKISFVSSSEGLRSAFGQRLSSSVRVPDWLEYEQEKMSGKVIKLPTRVDIPTKVDTSLIVELYSKR